MGHYEPSRAPYMKYVAQKISELRRYIAASDVRGELEETDNLLAVTLEELRRKIARKDDAGRQGSPISHPSLSGAD
jgi:hypothetical protein